MIIQKFPSVLVRNCKIAKSTTAVILSKMIFIFSSKKEKKQKRGAHLQYACKISAKFQIDRFKTVGGVDYTIFL